MIAEARQRFNAQMSKHEQDAAKNKQSYLSYCAEMNQKYDRQKSEEMTRFAQQKKQLIAQHDAQLADMDAAKKRDLIASYQAMQQTVLTKVSPQKIASMVKDQKARAKTLKNSFSSEVVVVNVRTL